MSTIVHVCLSVRGALLNRSFDGFTNSDGTTATRRQVEEFLLEELSKGHEVIPMSNDCVGFDYKTGCPGHKKEDATPS